jgi:aspartate/methionine/tyrosine aminotransferase
MRRRVWTALDGRSEWEVPGGLGAFYAFIRVNTRSDSLSVTERLIREHRVAVIPGSAFGMHQGCYLRVSYGALDERTVDDGLARLVQGLHAVT